MRLCELPSCGRVHYAKGLCNMHWSRVRSSGSTAPPHRVTDEECQAKFWTRVRKSEGGCWNWTGPLDNHGYGTVMVKVGGKWIHNRAHRYSWFLKHGTWPMPCALHRCDTPTCVNPSHLFEGTRQDNTADMMRKGRHRPVPRVLVCQRGHEMKGSNLKTKRLKTRRGVVARFCGECSKLKERERRRKRGAK